MQLEGGSGSTMSCTPPEALVGQSEKKEDYTRCCQVVLPHVLIGPVSVATDPESFGKYNIAAVVTVMEEPLKVIKSGIDYLHVSLRDDNKAMLDLRKICERLSAFIDKQRAGAVLVHCSSGISRSSFIVRAYLMHAKRYTLKDAFFKVAEARPVILPNDTLFAGLQQFENDLGLSMKAGGSMGSDLYEALSLRAISGGKHSIEHCMKVLEEHEGNVELAALTLLGCGD